jgi:hypothetical protein
VGDAASEGVIFEIDELVGVHVAGDLEVLLAGLEVLAEGEDGEAEIAELIDDVLDLGDLFAEAEHEAGLGEGAAPARAA